MKVALWRDRAGRRMARIIPRSSVLRLNRVAAVVSATAVPRQVFWANTAICDSKPPCRRWCKSGGPLSARPLDSHDAMFRRGTSWN
jgi:hypothetical protein